jgi:predicted hotdog family 3-hydroxylacyl-ACP dehydratase
VQQIRAGASVNYSKTKFMERKEKIMTTIFLGYLALMAAFAIGCWAGATLQAQDATHSEGGE